MKKLHIISGILLVLVFIITGQYMSRTLGLPESEFTAQRMMYRASHVYLLWAGAINIFTGCYWQIFQYKYARFFQYAASYLILLSQPVLLMAFYIEPAAINTERSYTLTGTILLLAGVVSVLIATRINHSRIK